jgi:hypothetical protein
MYGLESAHLTETLKLKINIFQRKGVRQIMKLPTTYGQMKAGKTKSNTNENILKLVNGRSKHEARKRQQRNGTNEKRSGNISKTTNENAKRNQTV